MVDDDRLDELVGGGSNDGDSGGNNKQDVTTKSEKTKKDKLEQFKNNDSSSSRSGGGGTEDVKNLLFCLANMDAYTRVVIDYDFDVFNSSQRKIKDEFAKDVAGEITNFLGVFDIRDITDEYGYQWQNILELAIDNHDFKGDSLRTNSGNVKKDDVKELLDCIANVTLYVEGNYQNKKDMDDKSMRDETILTVSENMYDQYKKIISEVGVQRIAEKHGYDWEEDVVKDVLENQDLQSKIQG